MVYLGSFLFFFSSLKLLSCTCVILRGAHLHVELPGHDLVLAPLPKARKFVMDLRQKFISCSRNDPEQVLMSAGGPPQGGASGTQPLSYCVSNFPWALHGLHVAGGSGPGTFPLLKALGWNWHRKPLLFSEG